MRTLLLATFLSLIGTTGAPAPGTQGAEAPLRGVDVREVVGTVRVSLADAIAAALRARPGRAVEAELETDDEEGQKAGTVYEVAVVTEEGSLYEIVVDPGDGTVRAQHEETDPEELEELRGFLVALRYSDRNLEQLLAQAAELVKGTPVAAELEMEAANPTANVLLAAGRYLVAVAVEARGGQIVGLELEEIGQSERSHCGDGR